MNRRALAGFRLIGALTTFWLVLWPGWLYLTGRITDRQMMTIDSPERHHFFAFAARLLVAAVLAGPVGFWLGGRAGRPVVAGGRGLGWLAPTALGLGTVWLLATVGVVLWTLLLLGQPGLKLEPPAGPAP